MWNLSVPCEQKMNWEKLVIEGPSFSIALKWRGHLPSHGEWGWHFAVGWCTSVTVAAIGSRGHLSEARPTSFLLLAEIEQFFPSSDTSVLRSLVSGLCPSFGWFFRLQSCWINSFLVLFREPAVVKRFFFWPTCGYLHEEGFSLRCSKCPAPNTFFIPWLLLGQCVYYSPKPTLVTGDCDTTG